MQISSVIANQTIRDTLFSVLNKTEDDGFFRVSNQSLMTVVTDVNGIDRIAEIRIIVKEPNEDIDAHAFIADTVEEYHAKLAEQEEKARKRKEEALRKKAEREAKLAEREAKKKQKEQEQEEHE